MLRSLSGGRKQAQPTGSGQESVKVKKIRSNECSVDILSIYTVDSTGEVFREKSSGFGLIQAYKRQVYIYKNMKNREK